jgi:excisionase family DNA binding protein
MEMPSLYTPKEVAEYLKISRGAVYNLVAKQEIESLKVGRHRRFTAQHVKNYMTAKRTVEVMY